MAYIEGFILPVHRDKKDEYREFAESVWTQLFQPCGVLRNYEAWADDVPDGKLTDFRKAVNAEHGEDAVLAWLEYPDRATRDATNEKMRSGDQTPNTGIPFDGKRMIFGGFEPLVDQGNKAGGYADGFVVPVAENKKEAYRAQAQKMAGIFQEYGAVRVVESWADDVPDGTVTDFRRAVQAQDGEQVVFSFIEWPDKATRNSGWDQVMKDERAQPDGEPPFDGKRMFWGGFQSILDKRAD